VPVAANHDQVGAGLFDDFDDLVARASLADQELPPDPGAAEEAECLLPDIRLLLVNRFENQLVAHARSHQGRRREVPDEDDGDPRSDPWSQVGHLLEASTGGGRSVRVSFHPGRLLTFQYT